MKSRIIIFLFIGLFLNCTEAFCQDVIYKLNGTEIQAKVLEITSTDVKYKRFDNLQGPTIYISKSEVFMIKYENGTSEILNQIPGKEKKKTETRTEEKKDEPEVISGGDNPIYRPIKLNGPRVGVTFIGGGGIRKALEDRYKLRYPVVSQFGWQFETKFFTTEQGLSGMVEFIPLVGGFEQGLFLPSATGIIGLRGRNGWEVGVGPNVSLSGLGVVVALGTSFHASGVNFPVNFAINSSANGLTYTLTAGFNLRRNY